MGSLAGCRAAVCMQLRTACAVCAPGAGSAETCLDQSVSAWPHACSALSCAGQFGPNATTWLLPGEVFPTDIRATCHGVSAATGKVGALVAGIWFAYLTNAGKFWVAASFNLVRCQREGPQSCAVRAANSLYGLWQRW